MSPADASAAEVALLQGVYAAFNRRDIETVLSNMHDDVDWPNGWEGGRIRGKEGVRDYWKRQFEALNPRVDPLSFATETDGRIAIEIHQVVRDKAGNLLADQIIHHVYEIRGGLIRSMEIRP